MKSEKPWNRGALRVSGNGRYLQTGEVPFFWIGDTAWLLFQKLQHEEAADYLRNRRDKGFNVIQAVAVHSFPKADSPNFVSPWNEGDTALIDNDFARIHTTGGYWKHIDTILDTAEQLGLYVALLPVWGAMVKDGFLNLQNVEHYGAFLADRYGGRENLIWVLGGDTRGEAHAEVWRALAQVLRRRAPGPLMTFHPFGRTSSSLWFHEEAWLDFNMFQSGHRRYDQSTLGAWDDNAVSEGAFGEDNWRYVRRDHAAAAQKPTLDAEPSYEQIPQGLHDSTQPYWQDCDVRRYAYWAVFEGACGHTYGHNAVMQFYSAADKKCAYGARSYWRQAIHDPGAGQMLHLRRLMESVEFVSGAPREDLLAEGQGAQYARVSVFASSSFALFYTYSGAPFRVRMGELAMERIAAHWFDPAAGVYSYLGAYENSGDVLFTPPLKPAGQNDWVLVLSGEQHQDFVR